MPGGTQLVTYVARVEYFLVHEFQGRKWILMYASWSKALSRDRFGFINPFKEYELQAPQYNLASDAQELVAFFMRGNEVHVVEGLEALRAWDED